MNIARQNYALHIASGCLCLSAVDHEVGETMHSNKTQLYVIVIAIGTSKNDNPFIHTTNEHSNKKQTTAKLKYSSKTV